MRVLVYDGLPEDRKQLRGSFLQPRAFHAMVTHYDLVMRDRSHLKKVGMPKLLPAERAAACTSVVMMLIARLGHPCFRPFLTVAPWSSLLSLQPRT